MESDVEIRKAESSDVGVVSSILVEAALWLESKGMPSWNPDDLSPEYLAEDVEAGRFYLVLKENDPIACFRYQESDQEYWADVPHDDSHFVHRVAVKRDVSGKGLVTEILNFAKTRALEAGKTFLRLDCIDRKKLRAVYENEGFRFHSVKPRKPYDVIRYEYLLK